MPSFPTLNRMHSALNFSVNVGWSSTIGVFLAALLSLPVHAKPISLRALVRPSTVIQKDGHPVTFAVHGFIELNSLSELFTYIESQTRRWAESLDFDSAAREQLRHDLLRRGIESRIVSMADESPLETLITHTTKELKQALSEVKEPLPDGYAESFLAVQDKWKHSLNCWSATSSIPGRVLSNWYPIEEGIPLYGATYDSTEHFWQAVKYHPDVTVAEVNDLIATMQRRDWGPWLRRLDDDPRVYLPNAYAVEFLRHNLTATRLGWFADEIRRQSVMPEEKPRQAQQRRSRAFRFTAYEEKVLWGDLADVFQLVYLFCSAEDPIRNVLVQRHFDGIYLDGRKMGFISDAFRSLMLEIWKVKYLQMPRFGEVIRSIPIQTRLSHFLNDGDSPDIPIPVYIGYLNQVRDMAISQATPNQAQSK